MGKLSVGEILLVGTACFLVGVISTIPLIQDGRRVFNVAVADCLSGDSEKCFKGYDKADKGQRDVLLRSYRLKTGKNLEVN